MIDDINVTPFIDVVLVLLVVFILTGPMLISHIDVKLPGSDVAPAEQLSDEPIEISIVEDKKIYLLDTLVQLDQLDKKLIEIAKRNFSKRILVSGDANLNYGSIIAVIDCIKIAGFQKVGLVTIVKSIDK